MNVAVRVRPRAQLRLDSATVKLEATEVVVSGHGTNRSTHRHVASSQKVTMTDAGQQLMPGEVMEWTADLGVPAGAGLSFAASDNRLRWSATLHIGIAGWPDWKQEYPIIVRP